ncbi:MAG: UDP-N-acetylmuramate--L-alanine ligase, partial [Clostridiales bacterium]|nr:UDP-N-acetylmuramate--L-alanine ligase [Clostridiales bacterium]
MENSKIYIQNFVGKKIHMVGIGGSSMSGLAKMLLKMGYQVSGSDNTQSHATQELEKIAIPVAIGHKESNVTDADLLIFSGAIAKDNPEIIKAQSLQIPIMERSELLGQLMKMYHQSIAVAGTHGKTTVTGMLGKILLDAQLDPTIHIGGEFDYIGGSTHIGTNALFVAEACEFRSSFLYMNPTIALILNIEEDHLDYYKDIAAIEDAFLSFMTLIPENGLLIGNGDDQRVKKLLEQSEKPFITFGLSKENHWYPDPLEYDSNGRASFTLMKQGLPHGTVSLQVPGAFNVLNALAALVTAYYVKADMAVSCASISTFTGVHRRFEKTGVIDGVTLYHDYGHNPTEMKNIIDVAKMQPHNRLWAVMQPHTYSRVKGLFQDYLTCTSNADITLVTDIYGAREKDPGDIHASMIVEGMKDHGVQAHLTPSFDDTEEYLRTHWQPGDLVITMGCGNINLL